MRFTFKKHEKLKHKKLIEQLFTEGKSISQFPFRLVYLQYEHDGVTLLQTGFSIPKRNIKKAVDRNKIRRQMREAYRLKKSEIYSDLTQKYILMFIYLDKEIHPSEKLHLKLEQILKKFIKTIS